MIKAILLSSFGSLSTGTEELGNVWQVSCKLTHFIYVKM
jgi:hypothetical protein